MGTGLRSRTATASWLRGARAGALQRSARAVPAALCGRQPDRRVSIDSGAVLSRAPKTGATIAEAASDTHAAEVAAAPSGGGVEAGGSRIWEFPAGNRRSG